MNNIAYVLFTNNQEEVLMQPNGTSNKSLFPGQWSLLEGSMIDGELSGDLVKGIIEDNYINPHSFKFFKTYSYQDIRSKQEYLFYIFTKKIKLDLLKIVLHEGQSIDYKSILEIKSLKSPEIIKTIIAEYLASIKA